MKTPLPPDPEDMNDQRAEWALRCLVVMSDETGCDAEDALQDLLCNLMHWCDRGKDDFEDALERARRHYAEETGAVHWNRRAGWESGHAARLAAAVLEDANCHTEAEPLCEMFTNHYTA